MTHQKGTFQKPATMKVYRVCSMERGSSAVECRTRNQESPGSNPPFATVSKIGHFRSVHCHPIK